MNTLICVEGNLTPSCSKSHISYTFNLKNECNRLNIDFSYEPKKLNDIDKSRELIQEGICNFVQDEQEREKLMSSWETYLPVLNLLTVSIDDSLKFRGCVHRHSPEQHLFIMEKLASDGLIPGKPGPGQWTVTISVHAVVTEFCKYRLHVWEGE